MRFSKIIGDSFNYGLSGSLVSIFSLLTFPLISKHISKEEYGFLEIATLFVSLGIPILKFGIPGAVLRFLNECNSKNDERLIFSSALRLFLKYGLFNQAIISFIAMLLWLLFFNSGPYLICVLVSLLIILVESRNLITKKLIQGKLDSKFNLITTLVVAIGGTALNLFFVLIVKLSFIGVLIGNLGSSIIFYLITKKYTSKFRTKNVSVYWEKKITEHGRPLIAYHFLSALIPFLFANFILILLSPAELGSYAVANKFAGIGNVLVSMILTAATPNFYRLFKQSRIGSVLIFFFKCNGLLIISVFILLFCTKIYFDSFIAQEFRDCFPLIIILTGAYATKFYTGFLNTYLISKNKNKNILSGSLVGIGCQILFLMVHTEISLKEIAISHFLNSFGVILYGFIILIKFRRQKTTCPS